ncbi:MAG: flagellar motor protein MotB [bacterium]|nr:flagellar motor protein MotB [bacterium]MCP4966782.1 flagellar motor protein MotB [bacterium]
MARERKKPEEPNELRWLTTYADVVTLLMAFFVMLYAISQVDQTKFQLFVSGLADPFDNPAVAEGLLASGSGFVGAGASVTDTETESFGAESILDGLPSIENLEDLDEQEEQDSENVDPDPGAGEGDKTVVTDSQLIEVRDAIESALEEAGLVGNVDFEVTARGLVIAIATDHVLFASGSAQFGSDGDDIVAAIAPTLSTFSNQILVEGHTDTVPLVGAGYDNWNLSTDRALAVLKALVRSEGIEPGRLVATGYGEHHPRASNETDDGKSANRRVELVVVVERGETDG